ncbi:MAG: protein kinase family protein [Marmoricola sp.]
MPPISMSPGTVLDGRYRLEVLLSEHNGARFWRATDTVLERSVAVHVVASDDPRAAGVLDAARRSATVTEPHFLRVLDCDDVDGITWVINEWGDGTSLDMMLAQGSLPPMRAAWLTREVAEAIAAAHAAGLVHGRLNPEAVLVTRSGSVKIIGFVVNAAFERPHAPEAPYVGLGPREADVVDLAGILYAALTGRWPGIAPSAVPRAPLDGRRPLRPRQVRAGVPRDLDTLCDRVLHKEAAQHVMPIETALEIAAALSDYVGDPAKVAPVDIPSMHDDPVAPTGAEGADETNAGTVAVAGAAAPAPAAPAPAVPAPAVPAPADPAPAAPPPAAPAQPADPEETMAAAEPFPTGLEFWEPEHWEPSAPPPPFEQPADRPLFADVERRVPANAAPQPATEPVLPWSEPLDEEDHDYYEEPRSRRSGWLILLIVLMAAGVAAAMYYAYQSTQDDSSGSGSPTTNVTTKGPASPSTPAGPTSRATALRGTPVRIAAAGDFDPEGDPPAENPDQAGLAIDGNPSTSWPTKTYTTQAFGGQKSGVGIVLDLGRVREVSSVALTLVGSPTSLELWAAPATATGPPAELAQAGRVAGITTTGTDAVFRTSSTRSRYLIIWLTKLPRAGAGYQGRIAEVEVRS